MRRFGAKTASTVCVMIQECDARDRGCSSFVPVRVLMSEEGDDDGAASGDGEECEGQGWETFTAGERDGLEESCDRVTCCYASGKLSLRGSPTDIAALATPLELFSH